jgi:DNA polymerase III sliding clamp (beta) subunit (PCNA family)
MERKVLLQALQSIQPALADHQMLPILSHFWFKGGKVTAFNDIIAMQRPLPADFEGAVPGEQLLGLLNASKSSEVALTVEGKELLFKAGRVKAKLALLGTDSFDSLFEMPAFDTAHSIVASNLRPAIEHCLRSVSSDVTRPQHNGVTVLVSHGVMSLYATNAVTLASAQVDLGKTQDRARVILPKRFCEQAIRLSNGKALLQFDADKVMLRDEAVLLFSRLIEAGGEPLDFEAMIDKHWPEHEALIPARLPLAVERACIMANSVQEQRYTEIGCQDGRMRLHTQSPYGEVEDVLTTDAGQDDWSVKVDPSYLRGIERFDKLTVTKEAIVCSNASGDLYLIAARTT